MFLRGENYLEPRQATCCHKSLRMGKSGVVDKEKDDGSRPIFYSVLRSGNQTETNPLCAQFILFFLRFKRDFLHQRVVQTATDRSTMTFTATI